MLILTKNLDNYDSQLHNYVMTTQLFTDAELYTKNLASVSYWGYHIGKGRKPLYRKRYFTRSVNLKNLTKFTAF